MPISRLHILSFYFSTMVTFIYFLIIVAISIIQSQIIVLLSLYTSIQILAIIFSVSMIIISFTIWMFSYLFDDEYQIKIKALYAKIAMLEDKIKYLESKTECSPWNDILIEKYPAEINYRTGKPYKVSLEKRKLLREKALIREQNKRIAKTAEASKKRKTAKNVRTV